MGTAMPVVLVAVIPAQEGGGGRMLGRVLEAAEAGDERKKEREQVPSSKGDRWRCWRVQ